MTEANGGHVVQQLSSDGIGGSEIAAALGLNPWRSRFSLWEEKTGQRAPFSGNDATRWGQLVEPAARTFYTEKTGHTLIVPPESMFHREIRWARCTPDGIAIDERSVWLHDVQAKCTGFWPGQAWKHGPPDHVVLQVTWEMFVTGLPRADVVASIGGAAPEIFTVHRDEALISDMVKGAAAFWRMVETRTPPPVDDTADCRAYWLGRIDAAASEGVIVPLDLGMAVADEYRAAWGDARRAKQRLDRAKNQVIELCAAAGAEGIDSGDGIIKLQREQRGGGTDWKGVAELVASRADYPRAAFEELAACHRAPAKAITKVTAPRRWGQED